MVRIALDMCVADLHCPADIFSEGNRGRLLIKKGTPLTDRTKQLLKQNKIEYIDFPLPFEQHDPPPYTFSLETEIALFLLVQNSYLAFKKDSIDNPFEIRKNAYDILTQAAHEFERLHAQENPITGAEPKRDSRSILNLRTVGALQDYLFEHAKNVALLALVMGFDYFTEPKQRMAELHKVAVAGLFCDIGMMKIPSRILNSSQKLSDEEWEKIHTHPEISAEFVSKMFRQKDFITARIVKQHHERCDGNGYPQQLLKFKTEPHTLILAVADTFISMTSKRYFRSAHNPFEVIKTLNREINSKYDPKAVKCLNYRAAPYPIGSVAHFANDKLIQIVKLDNIPINFEATQFQTQSPHQMYNYPKMARKFVVQQNPKALKSVDISKHLDKIGNPLDAFDLLTAYGFTSKQELLKKMTVSS